MKSLAIHPKVAAGAIASNVGVIAFWVADTYFHINPPGYVAAAAIWILYAVVAYIVPGADDTPPVPVVPGPRPAAPPI